MRRTIIAVAAAAVVAAAVTGCGRTDVARFDVDGMSMSVIAARTDSVSGSDMIVVTVHVKNGTGEARSLEDTAAIGIEQDGKACREDGAADFDTSPRTLKVGAGESVDANIGFVPNSSSSEVTVVASEPGHPDRIVFRQPIPLMEEA